MSVSGKLPLAVLISGHGTNMAAIAASCLACKIKAEVVRVIADRDDAGGLVLARAMGLTSLTVPARRFSDRSAFEAQLAAQIDAAATELVVLAGFMRILSAEFVQRYAGRLLNVHPSLLPQYKGLHTHRRVLEAGDRVHGASVHFVSGELDGGPVIMQARVPVLAGDTEESLSARCRSIRRRCRAIRRRSLHRIRAFRQG